MTIWTYEKAVFQSALSPSTKLVLLALNSHVNRLGASCFPSYSRLMQFTSLKRSSVIEHINIAEEQGWLKRVKRFGDDGMQRSNLFHLQVPHHILMSSDASEIDEETDADGGPDSGRGGSSKRTGGVQQMDPEHTNLTNHSKENKRATALPANFAVTDEMRKWATENGLNAPDDLIDSFRDYHLAKGSTYKDWTAAFRTWIRNDKRFTASAKPKTMTGRNKPLDDMDYSAPLF